MASKKKSKNNVKIIAAPVALTEDELMHYAYWIILEGSCKWLYETPQDEESRAMLDRFMAYYAKLKMASDMVEEGKTQVCIGKDKATGYDCMISGKLFNTPEEEAQMVIRFFSAYIAAETSSNAIQKIKRTLHNEIEGMTRELSEAQETITRKDMRIKDLENALQKSEKIIEGMKNPLARSQGRLPGKRPTRLKTVPVTFKGKKR